MTLHFPRDLSYTVRAPGGASGTGSSVTFPAGDVVQLTIPSDQITPLQISPSLSIASQPDFSNATRNLVTGNAELKALQFDMSFPSATIDFGDLGKHKVWDGTDIKDGPLFDQSWDIGSIATEGSTDAWELGGFDTQALAPFTLTPDPAPVATPASITGIEGEGFSGTVATFADPDTSVASTPAADDYTATIDWGDGTTTPGTLVGPDSSFAVQGTHTYAEEGDYAVTVTVTDRTEGDIGAVASSTATVADAHLTLTVSPALNAVEGQPFGNVHVASFADVNPGATAADYTATIDWGDGSSSPGVVVDNGAGGFDVVFTGTHTYADEGHPRLAITIADHGGASLVANPRTTVADAPLTLTPAASLTATEGAALTGTLATFTDGNTAATAADFTATVDWGDGHTSTGTVTADANGGFDVTGTHTYADEGHDPVHVTVDDKGGSTADGSTTADVADAPLTATGVSAAFPSSVTGTVARFGDANPAATAADFTATIDWGDGSTSAGTVAASGSGFAVSGSHAYAALGPHTVTVSVADAGGSTATATSSLVVYGLLDGGSFVIGDLSAASGNQVTFWSPLWSLRNKLSGGRAPLGFFGWEAGAPAQCGIAWNERPFERPLAPEHVPEYVAVVVASSVDRKRAVFSGDATKVVVVRVDTDRTHGFDALHPGTGAVVATICG